mgnify:FL=1
MLLIKLLPFLNDILKFFKNIPDLISTSFNDILVLPENLQDILRAITNVIRYHDNEKFYQGLLIVITISIIIYIFYYFFKNKK